LSNKMLFRFNWMIFEFNGGLKQEKSNALKLEWPKS
jgi:hypothetical protein